MKKILSLVLCLAFVSISFAVSAATVNVSYDPVTGIVRAQGSANGNTSVITVPFDMPLSAVSDGNLYTDFDHIIASGDYDYKYIIPDSAEYGKYAIYVNDGETASDSFMYYDSLEADLLIPQLNSKTDAVSLAQAIASDASKLGIDSADSFYVQYCDAAALLLYPHLMPFTDSNDFHKEYFGALAMAAMRGASQTKIEELMSQYESNLGIDYSAYTVLSSGQQSDMCTLLSSMDIKREFSDISLEGKIPTFTKVYERTEALSAARLAASRIELADIFFKKYNAVLGSIVTSNTDYTASMETAVFTRLKNVGVFSSFSSLKKSFDDAVTYVKNQNSDNYTPTIKNPSLVSMPSGNTNPSTEYDGVVTGGTDVESGKIPTSFKTPVLADAVSQFYDVAQSDWEYEAVSQLGGSGIISGYTDGSFKPDNFITRAEFAKLIASAFSVKATAQEFSDVNTSDWYHQYVTVLAGAGIITGYDGIFNPNANITREDASVIVYRLSQALGKNYYGDINFGDLGDVSIYALTAVRSLGNAGIVNGDANLNFKPKSNLTRAEAAQLLYNFIGVLATK